MKIKNKFLNSFVSSSLSILPMVIIVFILSLSKLTPLCTNESITLAIGAVVMIVGLSLFQIGANNGVAKVGEYMGSSLSKQKKLIIVIVFALALGALVTCAEPSILIISKQIQISAVLLIGFIAGGVGIFVVLGVIRIYKGKSLKLWYVIFYFITFAFICILMVDESNHAYLPFVFDAGGITTGSATVPFILALGAGFSAVKVQGKKGNDDSFGLVGMASIGPIIAMAILVLVKKGGFDPYVIDNWAASDSVWTRFQYALLYDSSTHMGSLIDVAIALSPILVIFVIYDLIYIKLPKKEIGKLLIGFAFSYVGLAMFLAGTGAAMSPVGFSMGATLGSKANWVVFALAFAIGMVTILCEPAVSVLTTQIQDISGGNIKKLTVLLTLSIGVGVAVLLAAIRTVFNFSIMYYMVPGYIIALVLMFFCPNIFTAIAFDSGGTASGPMSVSYVVPLMVGITSYKHGITTEQLNDPTFLEKIGHVASDYNTETVNGLHCLQKGTEFYQQSFGVVAMIALTPIIAIQILGIIQQHKKTRRLTVIRSLKHSESNARIINL